MPVYVIAARDTMFLAAQKTTFIVGKFMQTIYIQHGQQVIAVNISVDQNGKILVESAQPIAQTEVPATEGVAFVAKIH